MLPVPVSLNPIDSSISILENIRTHLIKDSYQDVEWSAHYIRALTLKARGTGSLESIWTGESNDSPSEEAALSLESIADFLDKNWEDRLIDFSQSTKCFELG